MTDSVIDEYNERRDIATKVLGAKMLQGYELKESQCEKCAMPEMEYHGVVQCVVCPVLVKRAKKKKADEEAAKLAKLREEAEVVERVFQEEVKVLENNMEFAQNEAEYEAKKAATDAARELLLKAELEAMKAARKEADEQRAYELSQAEADPVDEVSAHWKILRDDASNQLSRRLLQGWTLTSTHCKGNECSNAPLVSFPNPYNGDLKYYCVVCGGNGSGTDGAYKIFHLSKTEPEPISETVQDPDPEEIAKQLNTEETVNEMPNENMEAALLNSEVQQGKENMEAAIDKEVNIVHLENQWPNENNLNDNPQHVPMQSEGVMSAQKQQSMPIMIQNGVNVQSQQYIPMENQSVVSGQSYNTMPVQSYADMSMQTQSNTQKMQNQNGVLFMQNQNQQNYMPVQNQQYPTQMQSQNGMPMQMQNQNGMPMQMQNQNGMPMQMQNQNGMTMQIQNQNGMPMQIQNQNGMSMQIQNQNGMSMQMQNQLMQMQNMQMQNQSGMPMQNNPMQMQNQNGMPMQNNPMQMQNQNGMSMQMHNPPMQNGMLAYQQKPAEKFVGRPPRNTRGATVQSPMRRGNTYVSTGYANDDVSLLNDDVSVAKTVASDALSVILNRMDDAKNRLYTSNDPGNEDETLELMEKLAKTAVAVKKLEESM